MMKGVTAFTFILLIGMTIFLGFELPKLIQTNYVGCKHTATVLVNTSSSTLWYLIHKNENYSDYLRYENIPEAFEDKEIIYVREDKKTHVGDIPLINLSLFLRCN